MLETSRPGINDNEPVVVEVVKLLEEPDQGGTTALVVCDRMTPHVRWFTVRANGELVWEELGAPQSIRDA